MDLNYIYFLPKEIWLEVVKFITEGSTWKSFISTCRHIYIITKHLHPSYKNKFAQSSDIT